MKIKSGFVLYTDVNGSMFFYACLTKRHNEVLPPSRKVGLLGFTHNPSTFSILMKCTNIFYKEKTGIRSVVSFVYFMLCYCC